MVNVCNESGGLCEIRKARLVISYLHDNNKEVWNEEESEQVPKPYMFLVPTDCVTVYNAHLTKIEGVDYLICCGRSLVVKNG